MNIAIKLTLFRFISSTLVYLFAHDKDENLFQSTSLVDDQSILII
jgi:hypothetical protein